VITFRNRIFFDKSATVIFVEADNIASEIIKTIPSDNVHRQLTDLVASGRFKADKGETFPLLVDNKLVLVVGLGAKIEQNLTGLRVTVRQALTSAYLKSVKEVEIIPSRHEEKWIAALLEGILIGTYSWRKYRPAKTDEILFNERQLFIATAETLRYHEVITICDGMNLTRDLINDNADVVTSELFEQTVRQITAGDQHVSLEILNEKELKEKGLNLHLAVNQASRKPPKLIIVRYQGTGPDEPATALIGKGLTFDSGGLNLKPSGSMETMRTDMSGAAAVLGVLKNTIALQPKKNVIFAFGMAENAIGSGSYKPGDVFKSYNGKTVEIGNTDAEGRLVLADALSYVIRNYKPSRVIDIATLTGACVIALGYDYSGLVATDEELAAELLAASQLTDDRIWRLPSYPELQEAVESPIADLKNVGFPKGAGGTITAAEFLRQFTDDVPWAHLDIAGTAFHGKDRLYYGAGATGVGVRLLTEYLKKT